VVLRARPARSGAEVLADGRWAARGQPRPDRLRGAGAGHRRGPAPPADVRLLPGLPLRVAQCRSGRGARTVAAGARAVSAGPVLHPLCGDDARAVVVPAGARRPPERTARRSVRGPLRARLRDPTARRAAADGAGRRSRAATARAGASPAPAGSRRPAQPGPWRGPARRVRHLCHGQRAPGALLGARVGRHARLRAAAALPHRRRARLRLAAEPRGLRRALPPGPADLVRRRRPRAPGRAAGRAAVALAGV